MKKTKNYHSGGTKPFSACPIDRAYNEKDADADAAENELLLKKARTGNMIAFGQLIEKYQSRLFNAVFRMVGNYDDALELTQEAFYRATKSLKKFRGSAGFYTWLFRIGINLCINHHRHHRRVRITSLHGGDDHLGRQANSLMALAETNDNSPLKMAQIKENYARAVAALEKLEETSRAVVVLRDIEQLNYAEISQILQMPLGTVKSRLSRARNTLREQLLED